MAGLNISSPITTAAAHFSPLDTASAGDPSSSTATPPPTPATEQPGVVVSFSSAGLQLSAAAKKTKEPDTTAPTITKTTPAQDKEKVSIGAKIKINFSEKVVAGSGSITLKNDKGETVAVYDIGSASNIKISGKSLTIKPSEKFELGTVYTVSIDSGVVKDLAGNALEQSEAFSFKTKPDTKPPKVIKYNPTKNPEGTVDFSKLTIAFNENIQLASSGSITLKGPKKELIKIDLSQVSIEGNKLTIDLLTNSLTSNQKYTVVFEKGTVADMAENLNKGKISYKIKGPEGEHREVIKNNSGRFDISLDYVGNPDYLSYFESAAEFWEGVITGDLPDYQGIDDLKIQIRFKTLDGNYGRLAQAGPLALRPNGSDPGSGLPFLASMEVDIADVNWMINTGIFLSTIIHEMGHALGLGTLWEHQKLIDPKNHLYLGEKAVEAYKAIVGGDPAGVPIENNGGKGTANAHWEEDIFKSEIMTGWIDPNAKLSSVTIAALEDLGYQVNSNKAETTGLF